RRPQRRWAAARGRAGPVSAAPRLAWRQARGAWRHFVLLAACVALGVAALVAVGSFAATLDHTLAREAKALTGGDLEVRAARPLDGETAAALADLRAKGASVVSVRELLAMARGADGRALLVELKAPGAGYPLYGRLEPAPPAPVAARDAREAMARRIADPGVRVASYDEAQPGLRRFFSQLASYLGLVGLASLLVGGIGVASSVATFVRRQAPTIAILKALGA